MAERELDLSFATIISIFPRIVKEFKPGLNPSEFIIPKGSLEVPGLLIISDNVYHQIDPDPLSDAKEKSLIKVPLKALECAQSVITDWVVSLIGVEFDAQPGIFAVKGNYYEPELVKKKFAREIEEYKQAQYRWFRILADMGNEIWAKTHSPQGISDLQREAAQALIDNNNGLSFEWLSAPVFEATNKCPFCKNVINAGAIKCITCNEILDPVAYNALKGNVNKPNETRNPLTKG